MLGCDGITDLCDGCVYDLRPTQLPVWKVQEDSPQLFRSFHSVEMQSSFSTDTKDFNLYCTTARACDAYTTNTLHLNPHTIL